MYIKYIEYIYIAHGISERLERARQIITGQNVGFGKVVWFIG